MKTDKELEDKIAQMRKEHKFQKDISKKLKDFPISTMYLTNTNDAEFHVNISFLKTPLNQIGDKIKKLIELFSGTKNAQMYLDGKYFDTASPYKITFENGIHNKHAKISYLSNEFEFWIEIPFEFYSNDVKCPYERGVTSSEYHYFPGTSMKEIQSMRIRGYEMNMFSKIGYYGGDRVTYLPVEDADQKEEFETVLFTGHIKEFSEFWKNQLDLMTK